MKTSLVVTVLNEEKTINALIDSILIQSKKTDEVIIVDGGSTDKTLSIISNKNLKIKFLQKKGNRSIGRNYGIQKSTGDIILITDAGCILDKDWVRNITQPFKDSSVDVVAGYYDAFPQNIFQKCLIPYVLVMPDKVNKDSFLPSTRSMALKKSIWKKAEKFPEQFSHNEDYVFAQKLNKIGARFTFSKKAIVYWIPRNDLIGSFWMFYRFAMGDAEAFLLRPKVILIFLRFVIALVLLTYFYYSHKDSVIILLLYLGILYYIWSVVKNYKYVVDVRAFFILPVLQILSDIAVITGTINGIIRRYMFLK